MTKELWLNLPVKDVKKSIEFFTKLGFSFNNQYSSDVSACLLIGSKNIVVMLFTASMFEGFTKNKTADTSQGSEILISIDAENREEVDALAKKALEAGGTIYAEPGDNQGWMYGCGFADLDGHRWNVLYMDTSKMPTHK